MAQTNVQAFSGDVDISSNLAVDTNTLFVDSVENRVGIGTDKPGTKLHVEVPSSSSLVWGTTITNPYNGATDSQGIGLKLQMDGSAPWYGDDKWCGITAVAEGNYSDELGLAFYTQGNIGSDPGNAPTEKVRIKHNGNVGIGTTNPKTRLNITSVSSKDDNMTSLRSNAAIRVDTAGDYNDFLSIGIFDTDTPDDNNPTGYIQHSWDSNSDPGRPFVINPAGGNVGIGTTNPRGRLDIFNGELVTSNTTETNSTLLFPAGDNTALSYPIGHPNVGVAQFVSNVQDNNSATIAIISKDKSLNTNKNAAIGFYNTDSVGVGKYAGRIGFWPDSYDSLQNEFRIYTSTVGTTGGTDGAGYEYPLQRMVVKGTGNVGVGITDPTYKLEVLDDIRIRGDYPTINFSEGGAAATEPTFRIFNDGASMNDDNNYLAIQRRISASTYESIIHANLAGNVGIGTQSFVAAGPKLQIYADGADSNTPGGGITLMRFRSNDTDIRSGSIFSMAVGNKDALVFKASSSTNSYTSDLPHVRMINHTTLIPAVEIIEGPSGSVNFSNLFVRGSGDVGRHYNDGSNKGSALHFSDSAIYPASYTGTINNDQIIFGTSGNRWKNVYTKLADVDDATGHIYIGNATASHHHSMTIQRGVANGHYHLLVGDTSTDNGGGGYISFGNSNHGVARAGRSHNSGRFGNTTDANDVMLFTAGNGGAWLINGNDQYLGINSGGSGILNGNTIATTSDRRIKKDIEDIDDASALEKLRLLMPKTYKYKDKKLHDQRVYGFIAQEVGEVLPYATSLRDNIIPNIQEFGIVSDSNVITFTYFNTNDLESNTNGMVAISRYDSTLDALQRSYVNLVEVIDEHSIRVDKNLEDLVYSLDGDGNVITETVTTTLTQEEYDDLDDKDGYEADGDVYTKTVRTSSPGNTLYVFGQNVTDFVFLDKPSIFTVATAALQEVDRQQQADKLRIGELETQITSVLARLNALENP